MNEPNTVEVPERETLVLVETDAEAEQLIASGERPLQPPQFAKPEAAPPVEDETPPAGEKAPPPEEKAPPAAAQPPEADGKKLQPPQKPSRFERRINELTYKERQANERAAAAETRMELRERELLASTSRVLADRERELIEQKEAAVNAGDMKTYDEVQVKLGKLRELEGYGANPEIPERPNVEKAQAGDLPPDMPPLAPAAQAWLQDNAWFNAEGNQALADKAIKLEQELADEYGARNFRMYVELDRRLAEDAEFAHVLNLQGQDASGQGGTSAEETPPPAAQTPPPANGGDRGAAPPPPTETKNANGLTDYDIQTMRRFNLNPNDPKVRETYLKRKG